MTDQPRERHIRRGDGAGFRPTTPPTDTRPYRRTSELTGAEMRTHTLDATQTWRQIGWHGQTGAFYALDERPADHEPGSYGPLWVLVDNEPPILPDTDEEQPETETPVRVEDLARLLCDADTALTDGPSWDRLSQTPGLGRDEYRNAARYLLRHVTVTQALDGPAAALCGDQIPGMTCTLPDGPHDDWKHRDEEGRWWSQMRVPPYSNRDRIAAAAAGAAGTEETQ